MIKKIILIIFLFFYSINAFAYFKIIATVDTETITKLDLDNEILIVKLLNKNINYNDSSMLLNNLIDHKIKSLEIKKENIEINFKSIDKDYEILLQQLKIEKNQLKKNLIPLIKEKIKIEKYWNRIILKKYGWKLNVNMKEIENKVRANIEKIKDLDQFKENLIIQEQNKKLSVFSNYYLNKLKKQVLIKFY